MRIGILALLHESNTFVSDPTTIENFTADLCLEGDTIGQRLAESHHEIGGFFAGLEEFRSSDNVTVVPLFATRATPSGVITKPAFDALLSHIDRVVASHDRLDGILVAPHGAAVSEEFPDADGHWLAHLRRLVDHEMPIIGTLDLHANLSPLMVRSCNALVAYRTNPHLDQRARGIDAARIMVRTVRGEIRPTMHACYPPLVINIERQCTSEPHLVPIYELADRQLQKSGVLSNSILLGFPYADVAEMGAATIAVTDNNPGLAQQLAEELADELWQRRESLQAQLIGIEQALDQCEVNPTARYCLLDMGDNVGGGSAADGTTLAEAILRRKVGPAFVCLYDPQAVRECTQAGVGSSIELRLGGKTDSAHGQPLNFRGQVMSLHSGQFRETAPRHGGIVEFDQGPTVLVRSSDGVLTVMLTSRRMVPFSLQQLVSCDIDPRQFRILIAKGVNAPIAAYREVCDQFIRVNTIGSTCADLMQLPYAHRRNPLYPFE